MQIVPKHQNQQVLAVSEADQTILYADRSVRHKQKHRCEGTPPAPQRASFTLNYCISQFISSFFLPQASIVTVIRLVNDAVDTIESEGTMSHPLCVYPLNLSLFSYVSFVIAVSLLKEVSSVIYLS